MESWKKTALIVASVTLVVSIAPKLYKSVKSSEPHPVGEYFNVLTAEGDKLCLQYGPALSEFSCLSDKEKLPIECHFDEKNSDKCNALKKVRDMLKES